MFIMSVNDGGFGITGVAVPGDQGLRQRRCASAQRQRHARRAPAHGMSPWRPDRRRTGEELQA